LNGFYWLASYPKSGNTWLRLALASLMAGGKAVDFTEDLTAFPLTAKREMLDQTLEIDSSDLTIAESEALRPRMYEALAREAESPIIHKVHDAWVLTGRGEPLFPIAVTRGAIYIVRDPRDIAVSYAAHVGTTVDGAIVKLGDPDAGLSNSASELHTHLGQRLMTWSSHVESWLDAPSLNLLLIRYEDMVDGPEEVLGRVAAFLEWTVSPVTVAAAARATRFETLRAEEEQRGFSQRLVGTERFFRRGVAGGWRDTLTRDQTARIERDHARVMTRLGYALSSPQSAVALGG
jgi:aryl sulfotransferase